jgi:hypothetical protein
VTRDWDACLLTAAGAPAMSENCPSRAYRRMDGSLAAEMAAASASTPSPIETAMVTDMIANGELERRWQTQVQRWA